MNPQKADIIAQLQNDILSLQGFKPAGSGTAFNFALGPINAAFPGATFPLAAIHEFLSPLAEDAAATSGFVIGLLSSLMRNSGVAFWIGSSRTLFPPALKTFGVEPDRIIFVDLHKERDVLWAMEEALKCSGLAAVVGEIKEIDFTTSRRLQLAVEQSRVTGFILRRQPRKMNVTACVSRWKIKSVPGAEDGLPGIGFPRWKVELLKVRNGKPGTWNMEWAAGRFRPVFEKMAAISYEQIKRAG